MARGRIHIDVRLLELTREYLRATSDRRPPSRAAVLAWREFFRLCDGLIRRYARMYVRSNDALDDCAQNVWLYLIDHLAAFEYDPKRGEFASWLYRLVRSATINYFRREKRYLAVGERLDRLERPDESADPLQHLQALDATHAASAILLTIRRNVSRPNYELLRQRWLEGRSVRDVAHTMGITPEQVWYREHRARKKFRELLTQTETNGCPVPEVRP